MTDKYQIPYINACIRAFAKQFNLSVVSLFEWVIFEKTGYDKNQIFGV